MKKKMENCLLAPSWNKYLHQNDNSKNNFVCLFGTYWKHRNECLARDVCGFLSWYRQVDWRPALGVCWLSPYSIIYMLIMTLQYHVFGDYNLTAWDIFLITIRYVIVSGYGISGTFWQPTIKSKTNVTNLFFHILFFLFFGLNCI